MSILRWLKKEKVSGLPDPEKEKSLEMQSVVAAANDAVQPVQGVVSKKRGDYTAYDDDIRAKIGRFACQHGTAAAVKKFSMELDKHVAESTVRSFKSRYVAAVKAHGDTVATLPHCSRGRPTILGDQNEALLKDYIMKLRSAGGTVNRSIVIAAAKGILGCKNPTLLPENGGHVHLDRGWAQSLMKRMNFVKRKATKAARKIPPDFDALKTNFLKRISDTVKDNNIPDDLILNWDQTGVKMIPTSEWTMATAGSKQVEMVGLDDKRQVTALLCVTLSGVLLPPQILYKGKTDACHPQVKFPDGWCVSHTVNHWSTEGSMIQFIECIVIPYVALTRKKWGCHIDRRL